MGPDKKLACSPLIGDYNIITDIILERCLNYKTMPCPPMTKRTLEIGSRYSPDMICTPYKIIMGNFIEAAEQGANVFIMPGVGCRLGYYDILHKQTLSDMGYECEMIALFDYIPNTNRLFNVLNSINPDLTSEMFSDIFETIVKITVDMDNLADFMRRNMAFEINKGEYEKIYRAYLKEVKVAKSAVEAEIFGLKCKEKMEAVEISKPDKPIRIGIIGEIYMVIEPFSNCHLEKWLAKQGVEIIRTGDLSGMAVSIFTVEEQIKNSGGYVKYNIGGTANDVICGAYEMMKGKMGEIDGIIHVKPSACSPEITAMTILQNMSKDFNVPVMYLTFDTESSEAGLHTRLEAFYDMLTMKKELKQK